MYEWFDWSRERISPAVKLRGAFAVHIFAGQTARSYLFEKEYARV